MTLRVIISGLHLDPIFTVPQGAWLVKGGSRANSDIHQKCITVSEKYLCYYWRLQSSVLYVGSVTKDYKKDKCNFWGRIRQYLQNHGPKSTNKKVFDAVNSALRKHPVEVGLFRFKACTVCSTRIEYADCSTTPSLTHVVLAIERALISYYKNSDQCALNG